MFELIAVATITLLAVISPGADFAMVTRNSLLHGRQSGVFTSIGIAAGVQLHVFYAMLGVAFLIKNSPNGFWAIQLAGAIYLVYIGWQTLQTKSQDASPQAASKVMTPMQSWRTGFLTNALNPKTTLFVISVYTQVVAASTPLSIQIAYGLFMSLAHFIWFGFVALFLSNERLRPRLLHHQKWINNIIGAVLIALGVSLALSAGMH